MTLLVAVLLAQAVADPAEARKEAADRFDRGMALVEEGDNAGALAELTRVYQLAPHPQVLFNLGLVYAAMNRPVEATETMERVLAAPGPLAAASLELARRTRDEQARKVARIAVTTNVPATVEVNGVEVARTPADEPVPVAAGSLVVSVSSPGHLPVHRELTVAGQTTRALHLELSPSEQRLAHLAVESALPDADVFVDGQRVGRTPLASSITVAPGPRVVELRRPGYRPARQELVLGDGARGALSFELDEEGSGATGRLLLAVSEPDCEVTVDGRPRGPYRGALSLPPGAHRLRIARAGFEPTERLVNVSERSDVVKVTLLPTPEHRAAYQERARSRRAWGWAGAIGGAALALGAGTLLALNRGPLEDARHEQARAVAVLADGQPCGREVLKEERDRCIAELAAADDELNRRTTRRNLGLVGLAVGVVAAGVGTALLLNTEDPYRYDRPARPLALSGWLGSSGGGVALAGAF
jgi:hypothetical protein